MPWLSYRICICNGNCHVLFMLMYTRFDLTETRCFAQVGHFLSDEWYLKEKRPLGIFCGIPVDKTNVNFVISLAIFRNLQCVYVFNNNVIIGIQISLLLWRSNNRYRVLRYKKWYSIFISWHWQKSANFSSPKIIHIYINIDIYAFMWVCVCVDSTRREMLEGYINNPNYAYTAAIAIS